MVIDYSQTINKFSMLDAYPLPRIEDIIAKISTNTVFSTIDFQSAYRQVPILQSEKQYTAFEACGKLYHFLHVPFGVKNGVACFQIVIDEIIEDEGLTSTFPYLDDVTICGENEEEHDRNLEKFLTAAKKYDLTLILTTASFRLGPSTYLGTSSRTRLLDLTQSACASTRTTGSQECSLPAPSAGHVRIFLQMDTALF